MFSVHIEKQALLASSGIEFAKKEIESYIECAFCGAKNSPSALYCERLECGKPLIIGDAQKELKGLIKQLRGDRKVLIKQILNDPDFEKAVMEKLTERKAERELVEMTMYHDLQSVKKKQPLQ